MPSASVELDRSGKKLGNNGMNLEQVNIIGWQVSGSDVRLGKASYFLIHFYFYNQALSVFFIFHLSLPFRNLYF